MVQGWADSLLAVLTVSLLSHSLLDSVTTGGRALAGCGRGQMNAFSLPRQVIKVAPFALSRYTTPYGHQVIISELMWVWLPGMVLMECCGGAGDNRMRKLASGNSAITYDAGGPLRAIFQHDPHLVKTVTRRICRRPVFRFTGIQTLLN